MCFSQKTKDDIKTGTLENILSEASHCAALNKVQRPGGRCIRKPPWWLFLWQKPRPKWNFLWWESGGQWWFYNRHLWIMIPTDLEHFGLKLVERVRRIRVKDESLWCQQHPARNLFQNHTGTDSFLGFITIVKCVHEKKKALVNLFSLTTFPPPCILWRTCSLRKS